MDHFCTLCDLPVRGKLQLAEGEKVFCCDGCQAVYQILSAKEMLVGSRENLLSQEGVKGEGAS